MHNFISPLVLCIQTIHLGITPIDELYIDSTPSFIVSEKTMSMTTRCSYAITTNGTKKRIIASMQGSLPKNTTLLITMEAPKEAISRGAVLLSKESKELVSSISKVAEKNLSISYTLSCEEGIPAGSYHNAVLFRLVD